MRRLRSSIALLLAGLAGVSAAAGNPSATPSAPTAWPATPPPGYAYAAADGCPVEALPLAADLARRTPREAAYPVCADQVTLFVDTLAKARATGRLVLIEFGATWCPWCRTLSSQLAGPEILGSINGSRALSDDILVLKIGISTLVRGRRAAIPSGEVVLERVLAHAPAAARLRAVPFLAVVDPAAPARTVVRNIDDLQQQPDGTADAEPSFDAVAIRAFLIAARDHARSGGVAPEEPSWLQRKLRRLWQRL